MPVAQLRMPQSLRDKDTFGFFEDWESHFVSGDRWLPVTADSSSAGTLVVVVDGPGGILSITQDATDNDEIYFRCTKNCFQFANNKPCYFETRVSFTDAADTNNLMFGFCSTGAADTIQDNGAGPVASATMAVIYKVDGGTNWVTRSQIGAAVGRTTTTTEVDATPNVYTVLGVEVIPYSSTNAWVVYTVNGAQMRDTAGRPIKDDLVYTNAAFCTPLVGCKTGAATAEVLLCDYVAVYQAR